MNRFVLETIHARRSVRQFRRAPVPEDLLQEVLEAGRCAPSGCNSQTSHFIVIQNPEALHTLKRLVEREFAEMQVTEDMYRSLKHSILRSQQGGYDFIYDAPVLIVAANIRGYGNALADCAVALENMMIAATALDLGACWINQLRWLEGNPAVHAQLTDWGLENKEVVCGGLALGVPASTPSSTLDRFGNRVTYIR